MAIKEEEKKEACTGETKVSSCSTEKVEEKAKACSTESEALKVIKEEKKSGGCCGGH